MRKQVCQELQREMEVKWGAQEAGLAPVKMPDLVPRAGVTGMFDTGICGLWLRRPDSLGSSEPTLTCSTYLRLWKRPSWPRISRCSWSTYRRGCERSSLAWRRAGLLARKRASTSRGLRCVHGVRTGWFRVTDVAWGRVVQDEDLCT